MSSFGGVDPVLGVKHCVEGPMVKADKDDVRVENTRLRALVRELRDEIEQLMQANQVEITNLKTEIEHTSKIVSSKRYISSPADVARKKLKKEKEKFFGDKIFLRLMPATPSESNPKNYKSLCRSFDAQNTLEIHNEIFQGKNSGELTGEILKPSLQMMERIQLDVLAENVCLSALVEELRDKICQLTEVTFAEIFKLTGELGSFWKFSESKGLVLWNEDEVRAKLRKEKAKVFCNLPNLSLSKGPHGSAKLNFLDCLRKKITRTCMPSENIYEVDNVFQIKPEMLADEFPPYWYFFTRPGARLTKMIHSIKHLFLEYGDNKDGCRKFLGLTIPLLKSEPTFVEIGGLYCTDCSSQWRLMLLKDTRLVGLLLT